MGAQWGTKDNQGYPMSSIGKKIFRICQMCYLPLKFFKSPKNQENGHWIVRNMFEACKFFVGTAQIQDLPEQAADSLGEPTCWLGPTIGTV